MSISNFRTAEPLYIVILRNPQAEGLLKSWVKDHKVDHVSVAGNRLMIHHQQSFDRFIMHWKHDWDMVTIWDTWHRRHVYI